MRRRPPHKSVEKSRNPFVPAPAKFTNSSYQVRGVPILALVSSPRRGGPLPAQHRTRSARLHLRELLESDGPFGFLYCFVRRKAAQSTDGLLWQRQTRGDLAEGL